MQRLGSLWLFVAAITTLGQGGGPGAAQLPATPVMATMPTFKVVSGPGAMFPALQVLPPDEDLARFKYVHEGILCLRRRPGTAVYNAPCVRRPIDPKKFSGIVVAEPMHFTGNDWMFHFLHTYVMSQGHIAVEIRYRQSASVQGQPMPRATRIWRSETLRPTKSWRRWGCC